jgi:hypothetical protein
MIAWYWCLATRDIIPTNVERSFDWDYALDFRSGSIHCSDRMRANWSWLHPHHRQICEPDDPALHAWLASVPILFRTGIPCDRLEQ